MKKLMTVMLGSAVGLALSAGMAAAEGGRLVAPLCGAEAGAGHAILATRVDGQLSQRQVFDAGTPRLPGFEAAPGFVL